MVEEKYKHFHTYALCFTELQRITDDTDAQYWSPHEHGNTIVTSGYREIFRNVGVSGGLFHYSAKSSNTYS
jgi:hypothetical protein